MNVINFHTHTSRCHHASGSVQDYLQAAWNAGVKYIGISDHSPEPLNSTAETPFECKVVEILPEKFSIQTVSLAPELAFTPQYREENRYVQGSEAIRHFETVQ